MERPTMPLTLDSSLPSHLCGKVGMQVFSCPYLLLVFHFDIGSDWKRVQMNNLSLLKLAATP